MLILENKMNSRYMWSYDIWRFWLCDPSNCGFYWEDSIVIEASFDEYISGFALYF